MFERNFNLIKNLRIFLQPPLHEFKNQNNVILVSTRKNKLAAIAEANRISDLLAQIDSENAVRAIEDDEPTAEIRVLEDAIANLTVSNTLLRIEGANTDNSDIALAAKRRELDKLLSAHIEIDLRKIKNLDTLIFDKRSERKEEYRHKNSK